MKKLETLVKEAEKMSYDDFMSLITYEKARKHFTELVYETEISADNLFAVAIYKELAKALNIKSKDKKESFKLELDCNYEKSKMHDKKNEDDEKYLVNYFSLVTSDRDRAIQMYLTCNAKKKEAYFRFCTSCKKITREQFEALEDELHFEIKKDKKDRAKTSERKKIAYNEVVEVAKLVLAVLNSEIEISTDEEAEEEAV